jgi:hypothetical protein
MPSDAVRGEERRNTLGLEGEPGRARTRLRTSFGGPETEPTELHCGSMDIPRSGRSRFTARRVAAWCVASIIAVALLDWGAGWIFPPTREATVDLPRARGQIVLQLRSIHPFLAEYDRRLVLRRDGIELGGIDLMEDTGGYGRAQLYRLPDGTFALLGSFDFVRFDATGSFSIVETSSLGSRQGALRSPIVPGDAVYLGAFDMDMERSWRFLEARESAERLLPPGRLNSGRSIGPLGSRTSPPDSTSGAQSCEGGATFGSGCELGRGGGGWSSSQADRAARTQSHF